jgi:hypothetical protein
VKSRKGNQYILVTSFRGFIKFTAQPNKSPPAYLESFKSILKFFKALGHPLPQLIMDNESSETLRQFFLQETLPVQFVPPGVHRTLVAERCIRTGKNHLIATFSSTHPDFPPDLWDDLLPAAEISLNHLRPFTPDPTISTWAGLYRFPLDFSAHPIHPLAN